ncbi:hypothetical protein D3C80_1754280 [compost metagenome]
MRDAGVVDQYIDASEERQDLRHGIAHLRLVGNVRGQAQMTLAQLFGSAAGSVEVQVDNGHLGAVVGENLGSGAADAAGGGGAGDDCNLALK